MPSSTKKKDLPKRHDPTTEDGVFLGYRTGFGGKFTNSYRVALLRDIATRPLHRDSTASQHRNVIHTVDRVKVPKEHQWDFPLRPLYEEANGNAMRIRDRARDDPNRFLALNEPGDDGGGGPGGGGPGGGAPGG